MSQQRRYVYMNYAQQEFYQCASRDMRAVFARRTGKTMGMLSPFMYQVQKSMPRGHGAFLGLSRKQIMARTMPAVTMSFNTIWGLREGENYIFGKPPAKLNYPEPIYKPKDWSNTISFANGFYWSLVSLSVPGCANGETYSSCVGDEGKFWPYEKLVNEVLPANSGVIHPYGDQSHSGFNPFYKSTCFVSDASLTSKGSWLEREEAKMDIVIERGPFAGKTSRQLQKELIEHARAVIDINDKAYFARQAKREVRVVPEKEIAYIGAIRKLCKERKGKFHLPNMNGDNTLENCKLLVEYNVLSEREADLLYNADFLITPQQFMYSRLATQPKYKEHLRKLRCECFNYFTGSSIDNISILGESYIENMKRDLPPLVFCCSILGIKLKQSGDGFYYALDIDNKHGYIDVEDVSIIDDFASKKIVSHVYNGKEYKAEAETYDVERLSQIDDCRLDGDLHDDDELFISGDWNSRINWLCISTMRLDPDTMTETMYVINSMFVKGDEKLDTLMKKFNRYYAPHRRKNPRITFFYDATAKFKGYALENQEDFKDVVIRFLQQDGWDVNPVDMGKTMSHEAKYKDINNGLAGIAYPAVKINKMKNEALIISLENAGVKQGYNGFEKDKTGEKLPYNPDMESSMGTNASGRPSIDGKRSNIPEEYRTDGSDAFDNVYIGIKHFRYNFGGVFACG